MATTTSSSSSRREQLKETLRSLEAFEIPKSIQNSNTADTLDPALIQRYKDARDQYLQSHIQSMFLAHIGTYDGRTIQEIPDQPTEEQEQAMKERLTQVYAEVSEAAQDLQQQTLELQQKHGTFCSRREELKKMIEDMEGEDDAGKKKGKLDESIMDVDTETIEEDDVDDDALAQEEERLTLLQQKKAQLEVQLSRMRQETASLKLKTDRTETHVKELLQGQDPPSPTALQAEAAETQQKLEKLKEMQDFYDGVRGVMEALNSLRVLSVRSATTKEGKPTSIEKEKGTKNTQQLMPEEIIIRVLAVDQHEIEVTLRPSSPEKSTEFRVAEAKFLTSTVVRAPVEEAGNNTNDDDGDNNKVLKLNIPPLDDLVKLCTRFPPGEELRFLMRETMARIRMIEARVVELAILHSNVLTKIGSFHPSNNNFGGEEQEIVCSLNECITVVLRLTADCPNVAGSVYISQLVGVAGWDEDTVTQIKESVSKQDFKSPWALIQAIQSEIGRLQQEEGLSLPKTPTLPLRRKKA